MTRYRMVDSPIGPLTLAGEGSTLTNLRMVEQTYEPDRADWLLDDRAFPDAVEQLDAYFAGELQEFDLSLQKSFAVKERAKFLFRAEAYNLLNHPNFNIPNRTAFTANFGKISSALDSRQLQLALKFIF